MVVFYILILSLGIALSVSTIVALGQRAMTDSKYLAQAYYAADSGMEDALLRLKNSSSMSALSYSLTVNGATASVTIPSIVGASRTVTSQGSLKNLTKTLQVVYSFTTQEVAFHYGAQIGAGGLDMDINSEVQGNVFSNGNVTGSGTIDNNLVVATNGNGVSGPTVLGSVTAYNCLSPTSVGGSLTYVTGGTHNCTVTGSTQSQSTEIAPQSLPVSQSQIDGWIAEATAGGTNTGNYSIGNNQTQSLGPKKITGNLTLGNTSTLTVTGTLYVQGNITFGNTSTINLSSSYGTLGGVIIADGTIDTGNTSTFNGSGQSGSYVLVVSTSNSSSAIKISNNATGALFYASNGTIEIKNGVSVKELTGYRVKMNQNSVVQYNSGLQSVLFNSGPGGSWKVTSWKEQ